MNSTNQLYSVNYHPIMMQSEILQPNWSLFHNKDMIDDAYNVYGCDQVSSSFTTTEDFSDISSIPNFSSSSFMFNSTEFIQFPSYDDEIMLPVDDYSMERLEHFLSESEASMNFPSQEWENLVMSPPSQSSEESMNTTLTTQSSSLTIPEEDMEIDNQLSLVHLLKAYGEAMEMDQRELAEVIIKCLSEKLSPAGEIMERLAFLLSHDLEKQGQYLIQESDKNFESAFTAFYQIFPYGRFAHFAANSAILEAMTDDIEIVHIVDFDMGEGVQWPSIIEAVAKQHKTMRLTSIKREDEDFDFDKTRKQLCEYATSFGVKLKVEETRIEDLVKKVNKREWLVFNCMAGLPHMGRDRSRKLVKEFLHVAKELLSRNRGIITLGDGDACEQLTDCSGFGSFFDGYLMHYQALLESMQSNFPVHLGEARMAMECLFVAPYVSSHLWLQKWQEIKQGYHLQAGIGLKGSKLSNDILNEAREIVKGESSYTVTIGGQIQNEMILEWRGTPFVRFSTWRS